MMIETRARLRRRHIVLVASVVLATFGSFGLVALSSGATTPTATLGHNTGTAVSSTCASGSIAVGMHVWVDPRGFTRGEQIICVDAAGAQSTGAAVGGAFGAEGTSTCGASQFAAGLVGRSGEVLDAVGLRCVDLGGATFTSATQVGGGGGGPAGPTDCSPGQALVGVTSYVANYFGANVNFGMTGSCDAVAVPTTTTVAAVPSSPSLNQPVTLTATVIAQYGRTVDGGTVTFTDNGNSLGTVNVGSNGQATLTTTFGAGTHTIGAAYSGTAYFGASSGTTAVTAACDRTVTGVSGSVVVTSGLTCVVDAVITGGISISHGSIDIENSAVNGSISANHPAGVRICGSTTGSIAVGGATGYVRIGDPSGNCAPNTINGGLTAATNTAGGTIANNTITGSWLITANNPAFTVVGNHH